MDGITEKLMGKKDELEADIRDLTLVLKNLKESKLKVENQMRRRMEELKEINSAIKHSTIPSASITTKFSQGKSKQNRSVRPKVLIPPPPPRPSCYKCMESGHWPDDCPEEPYVLRKRDE